MEMPKAKELKKMAAACRKAGIKRFKCGDFEFELDEHYEQRKVVVKKSVDQSTSSQSIVETDGLTQDELLFWSAGGPMEGSSTEESDKE